MLLAHTPGWLAALGIGAASPSADAVRGLVLTASQVFFLLKLANWRWLRIGSDRRTRLVVLLVILLLHAGVVARVCGGHGWDALPAELAAALGVAAGIVAGGRIVGRAAGRRHRAAPVRLALQRLSTALLPPRYLLLARACRVNRAPPF
jgi:hypothetical protein